MSRINNTKTKSRRFIVDLDHAGRRIDNFLHGYLKPIPKGRVYQMLRRGEVRINSGRIKPDYRLQQGDALRIPPLYPLTPKGDKKPPADLIKRIKESVIYEGPQLIVINKPAGQTVHAGTGSAFGVIEILRECYNPHQALHLVHRLDKETSGCLLIAKNRVVLRELNAALKTGQIEKEYLALLQGKLGGKTIRVDEPLQRQRTKTGEGWVMIHRSGKTALTDFERVKYYNGLTYTKVKTGTGRTHQIRVHAKHIGHPIAGDNKYGEKQCNKRLRSSGLHRLFLHASYIRIPGLKHIGEHEFMAPLPAELENVLIHYDKTQR